MKPPLHTPDDFRRARDPIPELVAPRVEEGAQRPKTETGDQPGLAARRGKV
jgi:hypothetical protein